MKRFAPVVALGLMSLVAHSPWARAESVLRYGISMADIPQTTGQPDRGAGAYQFTGYTIYDPLIAWEMNIAERPGKLVPGLATGWKVDAADPKKWIITLRQGVKFHDGSTFNADAVVWNLDKVLNDKAPHFDKRQSAQVRTRLPSVASWRKIDDATVEITTKEVDSIFPYQLLWFLVSSPAQYEKLGRDWDKFASNPSGTGPFQLDKLVPRERADLVKNTDYWDKTRIPKVDRLVLIPLPEALNRTNALLSGQVDLIETPAPDVVPQLQERRHEAGRERHPARMELSPLGPARLAMDRPASAQGDEPRHRPRRHRGVDERPRQARQGPGRSVEPVVRQAAAFDIKYDPAAAQEAGRRGRLFGRQAAQDHVRRSPMAAPARCCRCR